MSFSPDAHLVEVVMRTVPLEVLMQILVVAPSAALTPAITRTATDRAIGAKNLDFMEPPAAKTLVGNLIEGNLPSWKLL
jgi:hypothetical protein